MLYNSIDNIGKNGYNRIKSDNRKEKLSLDQRRQKGLRLFLDNCVIKVSEKEYIVKSGINIYTVLISSELGLICSCCDFLYNAKSDYDYRCKHCFAVLNYVKHVDNT